VSTQIFQIMYPSFAHIAGPTLDPLWQVRALRRRVREAPH
jgi:hypothetical protein